MIRYQFPVRLCYAITIHKAQGQSVNYIGIFLTEGIFGHGMLYTAISRITVPQNLKFFIEQHTGLQGKVPGFSGTYLSNIVYKEIFHE